MGYNKKQFKELIQQVLGNIDIRLISPSAVNLLLGTAAQESHLGHYLRQLNGGPAKGVFQIEPKTEEDVWTNYLYYDNPTREKIKRSLYSIGVIGPNIMALATNLQYQIILARTQYLRQPRALPDANDILGLAEYWKTFWNTAKGKGTVSEFIENYNKYVL